MNINIITVSGTIDKSPTSTVVAETLYVNFDLAVNTSHSNIGTQYYAISASGKNAEAILNSVNVGDKLIIVGKPSVDTYMKRDKQVVAVQKVWVEKFELCRSISTEMAANDKSVADIAASSNTEVSNNNGTVTDINESDNF